MKNRILIFLSLILFVSCKYGSQTPFDKYNSVQSRISSLQVIEDTDLSLNSSLWTSSQEEYSFLVLTDVHVGSLRADGNELPINDFNDFLENTLPSLSDTLKPKFCVLLGDNIDWGDEVFVPEIKAFKKKIEDSGLKILNVLGNHDLYQDGYEIWKSYSYPGESFYIFKTNDVNYYFLDSASGSFGSKQYKLLKEAMEKDSKPKIVFTHYPIYTNMFGVSIDDSTERNLMINLFNRNNVIGYFNGHIHRKEETDCGSFTDYSVPSFRFRKSWAIITVNPTKKTVKEKIYKGSN